MTYTTQSLGNGFFHHGVATTTSNHRGIVATTDGEGRNVVLVWLFDHRGGYALLCIDAETGQSEEFPLPFPPGHDCPFASILSSRNRYYTHFNSHFVEFDAEKREFTFCRQTVPQMSMGMTEDDRGRIWSASYPDSGLVCYDPATEKFKDYGHVYDQNWRQYQRSVAADDTGWIYFAVGNTASQIIAFEPESGQATPIMDESERETGTAHVYRNLNGKVYGLTVSGSDIWYELYKGRATRVSQHEQQNEKPIITSHQGLFHRDFPDGSRLIECDLIDQRLVVDSPCGERRELGFDYTSEGAHLMGLAAAPDGTICGGTAFPMRFFSFNPKTDQWINRESHGQWNTVARQGDRFFVGGYTHGYLLEWDPSRPWIRTDKDNPDSNPRFLTECEPDINRPHALLAHPDGKNVILAGTPGYGYTGGGLLFWDRETETATLLKHTDILPDHSTFSIAPLSVDKLLCGTTTSPGTGGERIAEVAELYIIDMETRELDWHEVVHDDAEEYTDLCPGSDNLIYGIVNRCRFFVFDPGTRKIVHEEDFDDHLGKTNYQQGPRIFVPASGDTVYMLLVKGIAEINPSTYEIKLLAESPFPIGPGGDLLDGRIYFASGSHVYSYQLPDVLDRST